VGSATALRLAERVAGRPELHAGVGVSWHFLLCLDPDGAALTEGAPAGPRSLVRHFRYAYRAPDDEQPEVAPAIRAAGDQLPESQALVDLIDELRPRLQCSLHGDVVGGSRVRLSRELPGLAELAAELSAQRDVPVHVGGCDEPYQAAHPTWFRPHRYGGMTAVIEVPMWASHRVADPTPDPDPSRALHDLAVLRRAQSDRTKALLADVRALLPDTGSPVTLASEPHHSPVPLTRGHLAALDIAVRRTSLRAVGTLLRLLDALTETVRTQAVRADCERQLAHWVRELEREHQPVWVPVPDQVELQSETVLAAVRLLLAND
jgi:hypothetical protein